MSATFDPGLGTALDRIRLAVGDTAVEIDPETGESGAWLQDETYLAILAAEATEEAALLVSARSALAKVAQSPTSYGDDATRVAWQNRVKALTDLIAGLTKRIAAATASGQTSVSKPTRGGDTTPEYRRPYDWQFQEGW
jgi:hypothetical protein